MSLSTHTAHISSRPGAELFTPKKTTPSPFDKLFNLAGEPIEYTEFSTDALLRSDSAGNTRLMKPT